MIACTKEAFVTDEIDDIDANDGEGAIRFCVESNPPERAVMDASVGIDPLVRAPIDTSPVPKFCCWFCGCVAVVVVDVVKICPRPVLVELVDD